jgi:hypothetical protein
MKKVYLGENIKDFAKQQSDMKGNHQKRSQGLLSQAKKNSSEGNSENSRAKVKEDKVKSKVVDT